MDGFFGEAIAVDWDVQTAGEYAKALSVVSVFVGDENAIQVFRSAPDSEESLAYLARAKADINEQAGVVGLDISAVPAGTTGEDGEARWHAGDVR